MNTGMALTTLKKMIVILNALHEELHLNSIDKREFNQIKQHEDNLNMLRSLVEAENISFDNDANRYLEDLLNFFNNFKNQIQLDITNEARQRIENVSSVLVSVGGCLFNALKLKIDSMHGYQRKLDVLKLAKIPSTFKSSEETTISRRVQEFRYLVGALNITDPSINDLNLIERHEAILLELKSAIDDINLPIHDWLATSSHTIKFITTEFKWYSLLDKIYEFLASYEVQRNTMAYNVANLADWTLVNKPQGLTIDRNNFDEFVQKFTSETEFEPTESKRNEINEILRTTLKSPIKYECVGQTMTIKGNFIRSSDIQLTRCPLKTALKKISVFAVDKFYVDADLNLSECTDLELHIFSITFSVQQAASFNLNGKHGNSHDHPPTSYGTAGKPGKSGMNSGIFFALANQIRNGDLLTV